MSRVGVVIVAGGSGSRVGGTELKQLRWVAGKPMLLHSLQTFQSIPEVAMAGETEESCRQKGIDYCVGRGL